MRLSFNPPELRGSPGQQLVMQWYINLRIGLNRLICSHHMVPTHGKNITESCPDCGKER